VIVGLGIDVVDVGRIRRHVGAAAGERGARFLARCFTEAERAYCEGRRDAADHYAARFAAKEAAMKALGVPEGLRFIDIEVTRGDGPPALRFSGAAADAAARLHVGATHLALTHDGGIAAATVVLERRDP
jgi:holo-[acyl-carrier protein] synthase